LFQRFKKPEPQPALWPFFADTHPNSTVGLIPPGGIQLDDGGWYKPSRVQLAIWDAYLEFWAVVEAKKRELNAFVSVIFGGDGTDDNKHSGYQLVTQNEAVMIRTGVAVAEPALGASDEFHYVRGTEAHSGGSAWSEELVAEKIGAVQDPDTSNYSVWKREIEAYGVRGMFAHHPPSNSLLPWTRGGGANRAAAQVVFDYGENGEQIPDIAGFGHVHHFEDSGHNHRCRAFYTAPFCLPNAFTHRIGRGWQKEVVGGWIYTIMPDGTFKVDKFLRKPLPRQIYTVPICLS
jgi:hypothetical protein